MLNFERYISELFIHLIIKYTVSYLKFEGT